MKEIMDNYRNISASYVYNVFTSVLDDKHHIKEIQFSYNVNFLLFKIDWINNLDVTTTYIQREIICFLNKLN